MKSDQWKTYRTRFLIKAKQLSSSLSFTDHLGRQHCGRRGDYLVESCDGVLSIAPRQIFEDIYVAIYPSEYSAPDQAGRSSQSAGDNEINPKRLELEPLNIETVQQDTLPARTRESRRTLQHDPVRPRRKSPQPVRSTHAPTQIGLM